MRNLVLIASAVLLVACESPTTPAARTLKVVRAPRASVIQNDRSEIVSAAINDCNGDYVPGVFQLHYLLGVTYDAAGGFHVNVHTDIQGQVSNPVTGISYAVMQSQQSAFNVAAGIEETDILHFNMVAKGPAPNEELQAVLHITVTPTGELVVFTDHFTIHCQ